MRSLITMADLDFLARTIFGEARGTDDHDRMCVAHVMLNRWHQGHRREHTLAGVVTEPWQFSCWNREDPNRTQIMLADINNPHFRTCFRIAIESLDSEDPTGGATHYYATSMPAPPNWAAGKEPCHVTSAHVFFKDID